MSRGNISQNEFSTQVGLCTLNMLLKCVLIKHYITTSTVDSFGEDVAPSSGSLKTQHVAAVFPMCTSMLTNKYIHCKKFLNKEIISNNVDIGR